MANIDNRSVITTAYILVGSFIVRTLAKFIWVLQRKWLIGVFKIHFLPNVIIDKQSQQKYFKFKTIICDIFFLEETKISKSWNNQILNVCLNVHKMQQLLLLSVSVRGERLSCSHVEKMCIRERESDSQRKCGQVYFL